jgi:hypothetical protein
MRNRSGQIDPEKASLEQLEAEIGRLKTRLSLAQTRELEKAFERRLRAAERCLERRFTHPA